MKGILTAFILLLALATVQQAVAPPGVVTTGGRCPFTMFVTSLLGFFSIYAFSFWILPFLNATFQWIVIFVSGLFYRRDGHKRKRNEHLE
jgi:hypothetical protein